LTNLFQRKGKGNAAFPGSSAAESRYDDRDEFERWFDEETAKQNGDGSDGKGGAEE
jgi:hypothetical protein